MEEVDIATLRDLEGIRIQLRENLRLKPADLTTFTNIIRELEEREDGLTVDEGTEILDKITMTVIQDVAPDLVESAVE